MKVAGEYKKCYQKISGTDIELEIYYTLLYKGELYCCCRKKETEDRIVIHFQIEENRGIKVLGIENTKEKERVIERCEGVYFSDARELLSDIPHFVYLEDTKELISEPGILENSVEYLLRAKLREYTAQCGLLLEKLLFAGFLVYMLLCLMVTVRIFAGCMQYRQYIFRGFTVSASDILVLWFIGVTFTAFFVWYLSLRITGNKKHSYLLAMAAVSMLSLGSGWMLNKLDISAYSLPVEYNYSYIQEYGGRQGKLVFKVGENGLISLPRRENGIPLVRYSGTESFDVGGGLEFTASLQMKDGTVTQAYKGTYNEGSDAVEIYVPQLQSDYGYGILVVTEAKGRDSTQTWATVGERPPAWYQKLLKTHLGYDLLVSKEKFEAAMQDGMIGASSLITFLWKGFIWIHLYDLIVIGIGIGFGIGIISLTLKFNLIDPPRIKWS